MTRDLFSRIAVAVAIEADEQAADNTAVNSDAVDLQGYESCCFVIALGDLVDANATFAVKLQDRAKSTDSWADTTLVRGSANFQYDDDDKALKVGYIGGKRYVRMVVTPAGNTGAWNIGAVAVLSHARVGPA